MYEKYHGKIPNELQVLHKCDVRNCINPEHLFLGTNTDNVADKMSKGRFYAGAIDIPRAAKIKQSDVLKIRTELKGMRNVDIAKIYNIHPCSVYMIKSGRTWKKVGGINTQ